jgi:hypothetical protein
VSRVHGKDLSTLTLNSQSLLADTIALDFGLSAATHDTTTMGDDWEEATAGLKKGDDVSHELFYDNANTTGSYYFLTALVGGAAVPLSFGDGTRTTACNVIVTGVSTPYSVNDMVKIKATYKPTGAVTIS